MALLTLAGLALPAQANPLRDRLAGLPVPGAAAVLLREGRVVESWAAGEDGRGRPVSAERTVFEAASLSKPVFAWLVMQQAQAGVLSLDKPVMEYFDERFEPADPRQRLITARMLLSHGSGLPNWRAEGQSALTLAFTPGEGFRYSGEGYAYLQRALERVSKEPLEALAQRLLFKPLGMADSTFQRRSQGQMAAGHDAAGKPLPPLPDEGANAAYSLLTTAADYARFIAEMLRPSELRALMLTRQRVATDRQPITRKPAASGAVVHWGLGWALDATPEGDVVYHTGTNSSGFRCYCQFAPEKRSGFVFFSNGLSGDKLWRPWVAEGLVA